MRVAHWLRGALFARALWRSGAGLFSPLLVIPVCPEIGRSASPRRAGWHPIGLDGPRAIVAACAAHRRPHMTPWLTRELALTRFASPMTVALVRRRDLHTQFVLEMFREYIAHIQSMRRL